MNSEPSSDPPEDPLNIAEPCVLSPASPKPIHLPTPTNIPVLEMQMDVGFNQTELHMSDPAMHNTETRPDLWRDPNDASSEQDAIKVSEVNDAVDGHPETKQEQGSETVKSVDADPNITTHNGLLHALTPPSSSSPKLLHDGLPATLHDLLAASLQPKSSNAFDASTSNGVQVSPAVTASVSQDLSGHATLNGEQNVILPGVSTNPNNAVVRDQSSLDVLPNFGTGVVTHLVAGQLNDSDLVVEPLATQDDPTALNTRADDSATKQLNAAEYNPLLTAEPPISSDATLTSTLTDAPILRPPSQSVPISNDTSLPMSVPSNAVNPPDPPTASAQPLNTPIPSRNDNGLPINPSLPPEDTPWEADIQRKYDNFLEEERKYVSEGRWEQFPAGSRLFVGNLSSEKVTKRDIYHIFHNYGDLAQISIKQAYGFVQFLRAEDCVKAMESEQGTQLRDKRIHLEVSKPQKGRGQDKNKDKDRRSRSPDRRRGGKSSVDRYVSGSNVPSSHARRGSGHVRSPTPPRFRDRQDDRYRDRSPAGHGRNRYRSPSPRRNEDDDLPLPRRSPRDVPDVQILVLDNLEREFISWVEAAFSSRSVRVDVLLLSPRLSEHAVVRRQIVEGVLAVCKLTHRNQGTGKIGLQIFDRSAGVDNVKFEEYDHLDPSVCAELVLRAKKTQQPVAYQDTYGFGKHGHAPPTSTSAYPAYSSHTTSYGQAAPSTYPPTSYQPPSASSLTAGPNMRTAQPNIQNLISSLDPNGLQNLLSAMNRPTQTHSAGLAPSYPNPSTGFATQQQSAAFAALQQNPQALASLLQQQPQQPYRGLPTVNTPATPSQAPAGQPGSVNMQDILARLGTYKP